MSAWDDLLDRLRTLHDRAGRPSSRTLAAAITERRGAPLSHTSVAKTLSGRGGLPLMSTVSAIAEELAATVHGVDDPDAISVQVQEIGDLWCAVHRELRGEEPEERLPTHPRSTQELILEQLQAIRALLEERLPPRSG